MPTAGCGQSDLSPTEVVRQSVLSGQASDSSDDAVVSLVTKQATVTQTCTATLVAPNLVVTARHCVADYVDRPFTCNALGDLVTGPGGQTGAIVDPANIVVQLGSNPATDAVDARGVSVFAPLTTTVCRNDLALIILDRQILTIAPRPIRLDRGTQVGERVRVVGYGVFELTRDGFGVRHTTADQVVSKVGSSQFTPNGDNIPPRSFQLDGGGLCIGDSGGPALSATGAVVGVFSKFTGDCTDTTTNNYFTETGPFSDEEIRPAFRAAGFEPIAESGPLITSAGAAGSPTNVAGGHSGGETAGAGGGSTHATDTVGGSAGSATIELSHGGTAGTAEPATANSDPIVYDGSPPSGGSCACRVESSQARWMDCLCLGAVAWLTRRRRARDSSSPMGRTADIDCS